MLSSNQGINLGQFDLQQGLKVVGAVSLIGNTARGLYHEYNSHMNRRLQRDKFEYQKQLQRMKSNSSYQQNLFRNNLL